MDGQNRTKLVDSKIVFPHGITLDLVNRLVYWADAYLDYIEVVDYEGKNRHTIIQGILVSGFGGEGWDQNSVSWVPLLCSCDFSGPAKNMLSPEHGPAKDDLVPLMFKTTLMASDGQEPSGVMAITDGQ
ncbi:hypothetical protein DV515_00016055 [Chloebia gouldiae]|uniref:Uncharacterized protein n=1 Tax=Chloebia gouldiae TaxID=44316 RepID=A0A3L8RTJ5_CHLGU|nr:hypothetical protein DV515_00016055 [Chloebia gouldiae]